MTLPPHARRIAAWAAGLAAMAGVFALYLHPRIAVMLAEQFWACFGG